MLNREEYLINPCRASSLPYWKTASIAVPENMLILHADRFDESLLAEYYDDPYFRLKHDLEGVERPCLPAGYALSEVSAAALAAHISACYPGLCMTEADVEAWKERGVYRPELWIAVVDEQTGEIAASGAAELDGEIGEGALEWIQVSRAHRGRGLGRYVVNELLWRMRDTADFVTVSGRVRNETRPERLYRSCGFAGDDVWHILKRKE